MVADTCLAAVMRFLSKTYFHVWCHNTTVWIPVLTPQITTVRQFLYFFFKKRVVKFLSAFAKLRKGTIGFVMPVCLSVGMCVCVCVCVCVCMCVCLSGGMEHLGSHWTDFHEILFLSTFRKSVEKIQVTSKSDKNNN
jgi:hypothetical protein